MNTETQQENTKDLVQSYLQVRQFLGYVALLLPFTLVFIGLASGDGIEPSISDTYFTSAGDFFVGALCAIGIFLWAYKGYELLEHEKVADWVIARLAAIGALGVAFVPTLGVITDPLPLAHRLFTAEVARVIHYGFATMFFVCLAIFCLVLFPRTDATEEMSEGKIYRNKIYRWCGGVLVVVIVLMGAYGWYFKNLAPEEQELWKGSSWIFLLESIGVIAFAISWLAKGRSLRSLQNLANRFRGSKA